MMNTLPSPRLFHSGFTSLPTLLGLALSLFLTSACRDTGTVELTLIHTNDVHSQHLPQGNTGKKVGGFPRLKTKADEIRANSKNSIMVDAGDFSEGSAFYNIDGGVSIMNVMDQMGYDVVLVGNHDYINGPDVLLDSYKASNAKFQMVAANIDTSPYSRRKEFEENVFPFVIREFEGVKVAFIGLTTFEVIFDHFFGPIKITDPVTTLLKLTTQLKPEVDAIVVISHNSLVTNKLLLQTNPLIDLLVSGHTHQLLEEPFSVDRAGANPSWLVQSGYWTSHLGEVRVEISKTRSLKPGVQFKPVFYKAHPLDETVADDPAMVARVEEMKEALRKKYGQDFFDEVAKSEFQLSKDGLENTLGNLITDSYRTVTKADVAFDQMGFIYGKMYEGPLTPFDIMNANPAAYSPKTDKIWTIFKMPISGTLLSTLIAALFVQDEYVIQLGKLAVSGVKVLFNGKIQKGPTIEAIQVGDEPIDLSKNYSLAMSGGGKEAIDYLNRVRPGTIPLRDLEDTGIETWRALRTEIDKRGGILNRDTLRLNNRIQSTGQDLAILNYDIQLGNDQVISVRVENVGSLNIEALKRSVKIRVNGETLGGLFSIPALKPGQSFLLTNVLPIEFRNSKLIRVEAEILSGDESDMNPTNDRAEREFSL